MKKYLVLIAILALIATLVLPVVALAAGSGSECPLCNAPLEYTKNIKTVPVSAGSSISKTDIICPVCGYDKAKHEANLANLKYQWWQFKLSQTLKSLGVTPPFKVPEFPLK